MMLLFKSNNKVKLNCLIYILSFFIGVYCSCYILSIDYISFPIDHWCSPPFDFASEHWSPKDWKRYAIPYWDQIPDSFHTRTKSNTQSKCFQFTVIQNMTHSMNTSKNIEIKYSIEYVIPCQFGWYFSNHEMSIISQLELVCHKSWILLLCPIIFALGFILSFVILKLEHYMFILYTTITLMLATSLSICIVHDFKIFIALRFMTAFFFGANFLLSILLIAKLNMQKRYQNILFSATLGWIFANGLIPLIIWLLKDWKVVHILMSFSVVPVILLGVILFKMQINEPLIKNIKYIEETEVNYNEFEVNCNELEETLSNKFEFTAVLIASLVYFSQHSSMHKKVEIFSRSTLNSFIITSILQFFSIFIILITRRKVSVCFILLVSLVITFVTNVWFSYIGLFGINLSEVFVNILDKIGVSATFFTTLIILIDGIKVKTTQLNFCLLIAIFASYGISSFASEFDSVSPALPNICFSTALLILIVWLLNDRLRIYFTGKKENSKKITYSRNEFNGEKCVINDS